MPSSSPPTSTAKLPVPESVPEHVRGLVEELTRLLEASSSPAEFYAAFLGRLLAAMGAEAGAVWVRNPKGDFQLQHEVNRSAVGLEKIENGPAGHLETLRLAAQRTRPLWIPPHSRPEAGSSKPVNPTGH